MTTQIHASKWVNKYAILTLLYALFVLALFGATAAVAADAEEATHDDIVDVAVNAGSFKTLVAAVKAAGLAETLKGDGPFTVLMPQMPASTTAMARDLIRTAINRGAPLYNQGNAAACASIYEVTAKALLAFEAELPASAQRPLRRALQRMRHTHDHDRRAWIMREGLDEAYAALSNRRMMNTASSH